MAVPAIGLEEDAGLVAARFIAAYEEHRARVLRRVRRIVRDDDAAEDVLHDVFLKALRALQDGRPPQHLEAWLLAVARTTAIDHLRRGAGERAFEPTVLVELADARRAAARPRSRGWLVDPEVMQAVGTLTQRQQEVILLRYVVGCAHAETARLLGSTERAIIEAHRRALLALGARLATSDLAARRASHAMRRLSMPRRLAAAGFTVLAPRRAAAGWAR